MDSVTVNVIAGLFGVIFLTCSAMAVIKIARSRRDTRNLGNRSVTVPFSNDSPVFDPSSSGLDDIAEASHISEEKTEAEGAEESETTQMVAEFAGEPIFASNQSELKAEIQDIEVIGTVETSTIENEETDDEPTGVISEGLIEEFLGSNEAPETEDIAELEEPAIERNPAESSVTVESQDQDIDPDELVVAETDSEEIEASETEDIEDYFDPEQPAFAARASVATNTTPLFKVAPPSVPYEEPETIEARKPIAEEETAPSETVAAPESTEADSLEASQEKLQADIALDPTVPIVRTPQPETDYSFEEVPAMEIIEDEVALGEAITNQISQLDADLDTIEDLVREIETSLADFEPLSGFEVSDDEKAA